MSYGIFTAKTSLEIRNTGIIEMRKLKVFSVHLKQEC